MTHACLLATAQRDFLAPRQVLAGDGCSAMTGDALARWGVADGTVAVIADRVVGESGLAEPLVAGLTAAGYRPTVFADVEGEPTLAIAETVLDDVLAINAAAVVGVGGGSAMDVAKIVALGAGSGLRIADLVGADRAAGSPLPLALIPTTSGTGAEVTHVSMLSDGGSKIISSHRQLVPLIAVLDPDLVATLPASVTAATGMDAMAHAIEAFLSTDRSMLSVDASLRAIVLLRDALPRAVHHGDEREARRATLYGAHLAGMALNAGVVLGHSLAYTIANRRPLPHGLTCSLALPFCVAYNATAAVPAVDQLAAAITAGRSDRLDVAALELVDLAASLGLPTTLADAGIDTESASGMASECIERYPRPNNPRPFELDALKALVTAMHHGDVSLAFAGSIS